MALGVLLVIMCSLTLSFGAAVGINIQKMSMMKEEKKTHKRPPHFQPLWLLGMCIIIVDAIGDFIFIGSAPQSLLAPLGSFSLGWNIILAPKFNPSEKATRGIVAATGVIYLGTFLTVIFATERSPNYDLGDIVGLMSNKQFHVYFLTCMAFLGVLAHHGRRRGYGIINYCGLAGCLGGQCVLFAKATSELIKNALVTGRIDDFTTSFLPYIFIVFMVITVLMQIRCLNTGLAKFDSLIVVPVYQSFWNVFGITGGLIFFQEYKFMTAKDSMLYALGLCITFKGVAMLVKERRSTVLKYRHIVE